MVEKRGIVLILILTILISSFVYSGGPSQKGGVDDITTTETTTVTSDNADLVAQNGNLVVGEGGVTYDGIYYPAGSKKNGDTWTFPEPGLRDRSGDYYSGSGIKVNPDGSVSGAKPRRQGSDGSTQEGQNVANLRSTATGYEIDTADYWQTPDHTVIGGTNIRKDDCFSVGTGQTVQREQTTTSEVKEYENCDEVITVDEAKAVSVDNQIFSDIKDSEFHLNDDNQLTYAEVESQVENNSFYLKGGTEVITDTGEVFEATFTNDGKSIETSDQITIDHGLETITTITEEPQYNITLLRNESTETNVTEITKGKNKVEIHDELGVIRLHLAPTSRYINYHNGTRYKPPFSFYIPQGYNFTLEIRKHVDQKITLNLSECTQCGIIDYIEKKAYLRGSFEFERLDTKMPIFTNIVRSFDSSNSFVLNLDNDMDKVTEALFSGAFGSFISGQFEIVGKEDKVYYRFMNKDSTPWIIEKVMPNILIYNNGMLQRSLPGNTLRLYAMNTTARNEFLATYNDWLTLTNRDMQNAVNE